MNFNTGKELLDLCNTHALPISEIMKAREIKQTNLTEEQLIQKMKISFEIMKKSAKEPIKNPKKSMGGLIGGEANKVSQHFVKGESICGTILTKALMYSLAVLEVNTSMGVIVAAPTAGSSGIVPAILLAFQEEYDFEEEKITSALFNASAIGYLIMQNASVAGAEAGCQAEVGSACAMASSAIVELMGGTPEQCLHGASTSLANLLGLICDPVAGLVEVPCQSRNGMGVANSIVSAEMALSGIDNIIPFDEMVQAMYEVGKSLPAKYRETALGGCAKTPTGCRKFKEIFD